MELQKLFIHIICIHVPSTQCEMHHVLFKFDGPSLGLKIRHLCKLSLEMLSDAKKHISI